MSDIDKNSFPASHATPDPLVAAKARFIHLMKVTAAASLVATVVVLVLLWISGSEMSAVLVGSVLIGAVGTLMLAAALVGLVFLSHTSGLDADIDESD